MKKKPSEAWIKEQTKELAERGMSIDYLSKVLRKDVSEAAAGRFLNAVGGLPSATRRAKPKKKGLFNKLFG